MADSIENGLPERSSVRGLVQPYLHTPLSSNSQIATQPLQGASQLARDSASAVAKYVSHFWGVNTEENYYIAKKHSVRKLKQKNRSYFLEISKHFL
jgi:hypothetical protein